MYASEDEKQHTTVLPPSREDVYIFEITKNVRLYEWSRDESEDLFTDIVDSLEKTNDKDFELNAVVVVRRIGSVRVRHTAVHAQVTTTTHDIS